MKKSVLITTPDLPPKLGGLSSFSVNLIELLKQYQVEVEVFNWKDVNELYTHPKVSKDYDYYINIHFMGALLSPDLDKTINFIHGSEILFTSPNILKRFIKKLSKQSFLSILEGSFCNISISEFSQKKLEEVGYRKKFSRDLIIQNGIPFTDNFEERSWPSGEGIRLCSIARDVPHKNLNEVYSFAERLCEKSQQNVELSITSSRFMSSKNLFVNDISGLKDNEISEIYRKSHLNLLFSLEQSSKGFFEGFGLTPIEAAQFGTPSVTSCFGGLNENVHHNLTGYKIKDFGQESFNAFYENCLANYSSWSQNCFDHNKQSHSMKTYERLFKKLGLISE